MIDPDQLDAIKSDMSKYLGVAPTRAAPVLVLPRRVSAKKRLRKVGRRKNASSDDEFLDASEQLREDTNEPIRTAAQQPQLNERAAQAST